MDPQQAAAQASNRNSPASNHNGRGASVPVTPSASCMSEDSDSSHGQQWWLPQPKPSLDEEHAEWRPAMPLLEALQCSVCSDLLKEAITAAECGHSYCYDCIDKHITIGGRANLCPVCNLLLGPNPFEHNKLKYDFTLDSLVRKVFPRPLLDAALEARRLEREEATRQAKISINRRPGKFERITASSTQQALTGGGRAAGNIAFSAGLSGEQVEVALFPGPLSTPGTSSTGSKAPAESLPTLPKPYIRAPGSMTVAALKSWLLDRLAGKKADSVRLPNLQLTCGDKQLDPAASFTMTLQQLQDSIWKPFVAGGASSTGGTAEQQQQHNKAAGDRVMLILYTA